MDALLSAHDELERQGGLSRTINDVQATIDLLKNARDSIATDGATTSMTLAKLKNPMKQSFDKLNQDVKKLHAAINNYSKTLDKKFKNLALPAASNDPFSANPDLTNRAIAMHLLREGQFGVASTFIAEANANPPQSKTPVADDGIEQDSSDTTMDDESEERSWTHDFGRIPPEGDAMQGLDDDVKREPKDLQKKFADMYHILQALRNERNLQPAIDWAQANSHALEARGSNLEFELCRLRFVELYHGSQSDDSRDLNGSLRALEYARSTFPNFSSRYLRETSSLLGSLAFAPAIQISPYQNVFFNDGAWDDVASSFTREFCGLLGLSEASPLFTAVTAGGIALPVLEKLERVMGEVGGQWTSANELPVEIPLPPSYLFHSIFVCPVSKEQGTDINPPLMMPCGHVIAKESLEKISKGSKFKCPYCPNESHPRDAKKVFL